jgi:hypothetical protein
MPAELSTVLLNSPAPNTALEKTGHVRPATAVGRDGLALVEAGAARASGPHEGAVRAVLRNEHVIDASGGERGLLGLPRTKDRLAWKKPVT